MKQVDIKSIIIPNRPRSGNYPTGSTVIPGGDGSNTTIINQGGGIDLTQARKEFLSKKTSDEAKGVINFLKGIKISGKSISDLLQEKSTESISDEAIMTAARVLLEITNAIKQLDKRFLRKDEPDLTDFLLSLHGGAVFGKDGFATGATGFGAQIDEKGFGEMRGLKLWESLTLPLLNYNRVDVVVGDKWRSPGAGVIATVIPDTDTEGNELTTGTATLQLEDGEIGSIAVDDIAMGIWHFGDGSDATEDSDDGLGNFAFAGFSTCYFRITEVIGENNNTLKYSLRTGYNVHPQPQMIFSCRGNLTNKERQTSVYETRTYTRMLINQNNWEIGKQNIGLQYGDLSNLNIFGLDMTGYSIYLNSVYFTGIIKQVKPDGTPVMTANDRGTWSKEIAGSEGYDYYDRVSHNGSLWLCVNEQGSQTEPTKESADWELQVGIETSNAYPRLRGEYNSDNKYRYTVDYRDCVTWNNGTHRVKNPGTVPVGIAPDNTDYWEEASWLDFVAATTLLADNGNLGGLMFKKTGTTIDGIPVGELRSQKTNNSGDPMLYMNTETGRFECEDAKIRGEVNATSGTFENVIVNGSIKSPFKYASFFGDEIADNLVVPNDNKNDSYNLLFTIPDAAAENIGRRITITFEPGFGTASSQMVPLIINGEEKFESLHLYGNQTIDLLGYGIKGEFRAWIVLTDTQPSKVKTNKLICPYFTPSDGDNTNNGTPWYGLGFDRTSTIQTYLNGFYGVHFRTGSGSMDLDNSGGNLTVSGRVNESSDERLKEIKESLEIPLEQIVNSPIVRYSKKSDRQGNTEVGGIAQYMKDILPETVTEDTQGYLSMSYSRIGYIYSVAVARELEKSNERIKQLENIIEGLQS